MHKRHIAGAISLYIIGIWCLSVAHGEVLKLNVAAGVTLVGDIRVGERLDLTLYSLTFTDETGKPAKNMYLSINVKRVELSCTWIFSRELEEEPAVGQPALFQTNSAGLLTRVTPYHSRMYVFGKFVPCPVTGKSYDDPTTRREIVSFELVSADESVVFQGDTTLRYSAIVGRPNQLLRIMDAEDHDMDAFVNGGISPPLMLCVMDISQNPLSGDTLPDKIFANVVYREVIDPGLYGHLEQDINKTTGCAVFDWLIPTATTQRSLLQLEFTTDYPLPPYHPPPQVLLVPGDIRGYYWHGLRMGRDLTCVFHNDTERQEFAAVEVGLTTDPLFAVPCDIGKMEVDMDTNFCPQGIDVTVPVEEKCHMVTVTDLYGLYRKSWDDAVTRFQDPNTYGLGFIIDTSHLEVGNHALISIRYRCPNDTIGGECPSAWGTFYVLPVPSGRTFCYQNLISDTSSCSTNSYVYVDPKEFSSKMVRVRERNQLRSMLFSRSDAQNAPDILQLEFKYKPGVTDNYTLIDNYQSIPKKMNTWGIAKTKFFYQMNEKLLKILSLFTIQVQKETLEIPMEMPFCSPLFESGFQRVFLYFTQKLSDDAADFRFDVQNNVDDDDDTYSDNDDNSDTSTSNGSGPSEAEDGHSKEALSQGTSTDVICFSEDNIFPTSFGYVDKLYCCDRRGSCTLTEKMDTDVIIMLILLFVFTFGMGTYLTFLGYRKVMATGSVLTDVESLGRLHQPAFIHRRRIVLGLTLLVPCILLYMAIGLLWVFFSDSDGPSIFGWIVISLLLVKTILWYIVGFSRVYSIFFKGRVPSEMSTKIYTVVSVIVMSTSLFVLLLCLCWMVVGMLLNPVRVASTMVMIVTVGFHLTYNVHHQNAMMDEIEIEMRKKILGWAGHDTNELRKRGRAYRLILTPQKLDSEVRSCLLQLEFQDHTIDQFMKKTRRFARYRIRYVFASVFASTFFLVIAILFVLIAMSLFTQPGLVTSTVASALIILAGVGSNLKKGKDEKEKIREESVDEVEGDDHTDKKPGRGDGGTEMSTLGGPPQDLPTKRGPSSVRTTATGVSSRTGTPDMRYPPPPTVRADDTKSMRMSSSPYVGPASDDTRSVRSVATSRSTARRGGGPMRPSPQSRGDDGNAL
eukprot:TRINITY_DN17712_c0_g1_i1.p1 TRINITY_DN17712_c0_g1~~TRINITY_DN17712_c0_g1_i1.p1  ORF type:complete len:1145 (-),score=245.04 TRINITY_DN17712_c0_g1_i1:52-3444(-)